jgi:hypothetical protein
MAKFRAQYPGRGENVSIAQRAGSLSHVSCRLSGVVFLEIQSVAAFRSIRNRYSCRWRS